MGEIVSLKGTGDGVKIVLDRNAPIHDVLTVLYQHVRENRGFFKGSGFRIYVTGRELNSSDRLRMESVLKGILPESEICFDDMPKQQNPEKHYVQVQEPQEMPADELVEQAAAELLQPPSQSGGMRRALREFFSFRDNREGDREENETQETATDGSEWEYLQVDDSVKTEFFHGNIRRGQIVRAEGNLLILGDIYEGGAAQASGSIFVLGTARGVVWAGAAGNEDAYIYGLNLQSAQLRIANITRKIQDSGTYSRLDPKKAYLINKVIFFDEFL